MSAKKNIPLPQEEVERRFRAIFEHRDITDLSGLLGEPYSTLEKKLNPNKSAKSDFYTNYWVLWHMGDLDDGERKKREAYELLGTLLFPSADAAQLASRIESDAKRLREMLTEGAH